MIFRAPLYAVSVFLFLTLTCFVQAEPFRLETAAKPLKQSVFLRVDPAQENYSGNTRIELELPSGRSPIQFNALDITVHRAILMKEKESYTLDLIVGENAILTATPREELPEGEYTLSLEFSGPFNRRSVGLYKYLDQDLPYLSTQFEMMDARRCFPCFDEPSYKIPYQMTIQSPSSQRVYSNTPELRAEEKNSWTTHEFATTPPLPSYLVALAVGPFDEVAVDGLSVPGRIVAPRGQLTHAGYAKARTPKILAALEDYFGIPYAYKKLDQIAVSEFPYGAMENAGMITYRAEALLLDEDNVTVLRKRGTTGVIAHEIAHQWFGNLVTMKWWDDLWLNEAFATLMATKIVAKLYPDLEADLFPTQNYVMGGDANLTTKPIRKPIRNENDITDGLGLAYNKGGAALSMVEAWMGEDIFREGVRQYLNTYRFSNAEAANLWGALGEVSGKDVEAVLKSFTEQSGYPLVTLTLDGKTLRVSQKRYLLQGVKGAEQTWTLPIFLKYGSGSQVKSQAVLLEKNSDKVELEFEPEWIYPDEKAVGYFRWSMPEAQIEALLKNRKQLSSRERIATLYNLESLVKSGDLSVGQWLGFNNLFLDEDHPSLVSTALSFLSYAGDVYVNDQNRAQWKLFLGQALRPLAARYGLTPKQGEHPRAQELRPRLLTLLAKELEDTEVQALASQEMKRYLTGSQTSYPTLTSTYLDIAAHFGDVEMVERVKTAMVEAKDAERRTQLIGALGSFAQPEAQRAALALMLDRSVTASDLRDLLGSNSVTEERRQRLHTWMESNFEAMREKIPSAFLAYVPSATARSTQTEALEQALDFYRKQPDPNGVLERELSKIEEQSRNLIKSRELGQASFDAYLNSVK